LPLTEVVEFTTLLQRGNRIQIPRVIRWQFKLDPNQVLRVDVSPLGLWAGVETFYGCMNKDGRITVPMLTRAIFLSGKDKIPTLEGTAMKVRINPT
jgi:hypothetical protein